MIRNVNEQGAQFQATEPVSAIKEAILIVLHHRIPCDVMNVGDRTVGLRFRTRPTQMVLATLMRRVH